ncbi:GTPase-associated protein 1-related protein [Nocardiopsis sp. ARC36]
MAVGPAGALFAGDRDGASARLRELRRLGTDDRSDPVGLLAYVVSVRREGRASNAPGLAEHDLDDALLTEVWGPGHGPHSALLALRAMRPGVLVSPGVGGWVAEAMVAAPAPDGERAWRDLVDEVSRHWLRDRLPVAGQRVAVEWSEVRPLLEGLHRAGEEHGPERLAAVYRALVEVHPAVDAVARRTVVGVLSGWRSPGTLAAALRGCPEDVFGAFCGVVAARLADDRPDTATAAAVYLAAGHEDLAGHERGGRLDSAVLSPAVAAWRRRHLAGVRRQLPREGAAAFDEWVRRRRGERERRRFGLGRRAGGRHT